MRFPNRILAFVLLATFIASVPFSSAIAQEKDTRPNILFIFSDDHAYQSISAYDSIVNKTPNLDRIANEGMRFDRAFVTNSICGPSRAVVLTGKYGHLNGFVRNGNTFNGHQQTVSKLLQKSGYETAVIGKWHLKSTPVGFDYYHVLIGQGPYYNPPMKTTDGPVNHVGYTTEIITDQTLKYLKQRRDPDKPFFLMYQHKAPHRNWQPGPNEINNYNNETIPEPITLFDDYKGRTSAARNQEMTVKEHLTRFDLKLDPPRNLTPEQLKVWNDAYDEKNAELEKLNLEGDDLIRWKYQRYVKDYLRCIDSVDKNVGRVLDYLEESGLAENTIVIYTSDQGWYLGEHGWYDKRWMYEESFRTPLMVRWPGKIKPGTVNTDMVMNLDFAQTFLDIAGADQPDDMQGASMKPVFEGNTPDDWRKSVYYHYYEFPGAHSVAKHNGVRTERYKLINFYENKEWELFDLKEDPNELNSVYDDPDYADIKKDLEVELQRLQEFYKDDGTIVNFGADRAKLHPTELVRRFRFGEFDNIERSPYGAAVLCDGKKPLFQIPSTGKFSPDFKPITLGGFINPTAADGVIAAQGGQAMGYTMRLKDGNLLFSVRSEGQLFTAVGPAIELNEWTHVIAVLDRNAKLAFIVNGKKIKTDVKAAFISSAPADGFTLGIDGGSLVEDYGATNGLQGKMADFRLFWGTLDNETLQSWVNPK
jgi:arylsulfatase A-like enzyme